MCQTSAPRKNCHPPDCIRILRKKVRIIKTYLECIACLYVLHVRRRRSRYWVLSFKGSSWTITSRAYVCASPSLFLSVLFFCIFLSPLTPSPVQASKLGVCLTVNLPAFQCNSFISTKYSYNIVGRKLSHSQVKQNSSWSGDRTMDQHRHWS